MSRIAPFTVLAAVVVTACALNPAGEREIPVATVALRADSASDAAAVAAALRQGETRTALVVAPRDDDWFRAVAGAADMELSGPGRTEGGLGLAFIGLEPVGDTAIELTYEGGDLMVQDALYDLDKRRFLDLLAFQVEDPAAARPVIAALLEYVATDVSPTAAVVMAVAVPTPAVGDSVARMLSPGFEDALRCENGGSGAAAGSSAATAAERAGIRMFYGPEARIFCRGASVEDTALGDLVRADLVMGRR